MERRRGYIVTSPGLSALDRIYMRRACELAERGRGSTAPNPMVGAVLARASTTLGEGFHHVRGEPHAEVEAFRDASLRGHDLRDATLYVSLEPCDHQGLTPPCSQAVLDAGVSRVVIGTLDPNPKAAGGSRRLREAGVSVVLASDPWARALVEDFAYGFTHSERPYVRLKMAVSLDGFVARRSGEQYWLTGEPSRSFVRELRCSYDAVMVGAGTVRTDDPQLTVRPPRARRRPYVRVVACENAAVPANSRVFAELDGYTKTIVLAPAGLRERFADLESIADVVYVGSDEATLDLAAALGVLRERGLSSVLCEGGPTLAGHLIAANLVDRIDWLVAPRLLGGPEAVPALGRTAVTAMLQYDPVHHLGQDLHVSARVDV